MSFLKDIGYHPPLTWVLPPSLFTGAPHHNMIIRELHGCRVGIFESVLRDMGVLVGPDIGGVESDVSTDNSIHILPISESCEGKIILFSGSRRLFEQPSREIVVEKLMFLDDMLYYIEKGILHCVSLINLEVVDNLTCEQKKEVLLNLLG